MSYYCEEKVIRMKFDVLEARKQGIDSKWELEDIYPNLFGIGVNRFEVAPTEEDYIDYVLETGKGEGEFGSSRLLTKEELEKYLPLFQKIYPKVQPKDLRYVHFCWYNCSEADDYFDVDVIKENKCEYCSTTDVNIENSCEEYFIHKLFDVIEEGVNKDTSLMKDGESLCMYLREYRKIPKWELVCECDGKVLKSEIPYCPNCGKPLYY